MHLQYIYKTREDDLSMKISCEREMKDVTPYNRMVLD